MPIFAKHQVYDALAVISVCYLEEFEAKDVNEYFKTFKGARRRFSETFAGDNVIIDDYAHHPNEVKSTIEAVRQKYPDKKIVTIFQPHTFSRTEEFASDLVQVFNTVDAAYVMDIHPAREKQEDFPNVTKEIITSKLKNGAGIGIDDAKILDKYDNTVFLFMSPNDISKLENDLINLKKN